jgi:hypothetical protein
MDQDRRKRRSVILMSLAVLAMICSFWVVYPRGMQAYRTYRIKATLRSFQTPPETTVLSIDTMHVLGVPLGTGVYFTHLPPEKIKAHYKTEFARHGLSYTGETAKPESQTSVHFCTTPYSVDLDLSAPVPIPVESAKSAVIYMISIHEVAAC